jgi:hypothetical protein
MTDGHTVERLTSLQQQRITKSEYTKGSRLQSIRHLPEQNPNVTGDSCTLESLDLSGREKQQKVGQNYIRRSFVIRILHQILLGLRTQGRCRSFLVEMRNTCRDFVRIPERKTPLGRPKRRQKDKEYS